MWGITPASATARFCFRTLLSATARKSATPRFCIPRSSSITTCKSGARVRIHSGSVIGSDGFGYVLDDGTRHKVPQVGTVVIEDDVELGANVCIDRATMGATRVGKGTKIDNLVQVAHNCQIGRNVILCGTSRLVGQRCSRRRRGDCGSGRRARSCNDWARRDGRRAKRPDGRCRRRQLSLGQPGGRTPRFSQKRRCCAQNFPKPFAPCANSKSRWGSCKKQVAALQEKVS